MTDLIDKLPSDEDIKRWIREDKPDYSILMAGVGRRFDRERISNGSFLEKIYYSFKHWFLNNFSENYRQAKGLGFYK